MTRRLSFGPDFGRAKSRQQILDTHASPATVLPVSAVRVQHQQRSRGFVVEILLTAALLLPSCLVAAVQSQVLDTAAMVQRLAGVLCCKGRAGQGKRGAGVVAVIAGSEKGRCLSRMYVRGEGGLGCRGDGIMSVLLVAVGRHDRGRYRGGREVRHRGQ